MDGTDRPVASEFSWPSSFSVCFIFGPRRAAHVGSRFPEQEWSSVAPAGGVQESRALGVPPREYQLFPADFRRLGRNRRSLQGGTGRHRAPACASSSRWETSPRAQRPVCRGHTSSLPGGAHWASFCQGKTPHKQWPLPRATLAWLVMAGAQEPPAPTGLSDVSPVPFQPACPGWGQGSIVSSRPGPLSSGPKLSCFASCVTLNLRCMDIL